MSTPREDGLAMPAEWAPHAATYMEWPTRLDLWGDLFADAKRDYAEVANAIAGFEPVVMVANPEQVDEARRHLSDGVEILPIPIDDSWMRDNGPVFVTDGRGRVALIHFRFNSWGGKFLPYDRDAEVPRHVASHLGMRRYEAPMVLEGGSFFVDGEGTLLTTEQCLLNPNRNPQMTREQIEQTLRDYLGVRHILWLGDGIVGDDTDGHIDDLARFVDPSTVVTVLEGNRRDENYDRLQANYERLRRMTDQDGRALRLVTLPMPEPVFYEGQRLPASYANFYIANGVVLVPVFDDPYDAAALRTLQELFPQRRVVGINARAMVWGLGAFHCVTQQQPAI